jgi:hypothetical protein
MRFGKGRQAWREGVWVDEGGRAGSGDVNEDDDDDDGDEEGVEECGREERERAVREATTS